MQRLVSIPEAIAVVLYREHVQAYQHHEDKIFRRAVEFKTNHASGLGKGSPLANPEHEVVASIIAKFFQGIDTQELEEIWKQALEIVRSWDHFAGLRDWMEYYDAAAQVRNSSVLNFATRKKPFGAHGYGDRLG